MLERDQDGAGEVIDMHEVALDRPPATDRASGKADAPASSAARAAPTSSSRRAAEDSWREGVRVSEVVLLHDPRRAQAAGVETVLATNCVSIASSSTLESA